VLELTVSVVAQQFCLSVQHSPSSTTKKSNNHITYTATKITPGTTTIVFNDMAVTGEQIWKMKQIQREKLIQRLPAYKTALISNVIKL
jgi:hypothetical protein